MAKHIQLSIDNPCHENWDNMTKAEQGRFCASCQKTVIDFTNMSDSQLAAFFKKPILSSSKEGSVCGRFYDDQLDRQIEIPRKRIPWVKYFFQVAIPAFFMAAKAKAQGEAEVFQTGKATVQPLLNKPVTCKEGISMIKEVSVKGRVVNEKNEPVPFASVMIKGTNNGTMADSSGVFSIKFSSHSGETVLIATSVGHEAKELLINGETDVKKEQLIQLSRKSMNEVVVVVSYGTVRKGGVTGSVCTKKSEKRKAAVTISQQAPTKIYPNPVQRNNSVYVEFSNDKDEPGQLVVYNLAGGLVFQQSEKIINGYNRLSFTADAKWAAGIYVIQLKGQDGKLIKKEKLVVQ